LIPEITFGASEITAKPQIRVAATEFGGHCAFISRTNGSERYWAEARVLEFCIANAQE
jgi:predicted alpha/beta-fold hydrolase